MKLVSAVIITHNRKQLVMRAVESVLEQTYSNVECIVVDDASTDGTNELFADNNEVQYIYIPQSDSRGGNHARNVGIAAAKGEYVAFLDDDDYWLPTKIEKQVSLIKEKNCEVVYCGMRPEFITPDGNVRFEEWLPIEGGEGDLRGEILTKIFTVTSALLIKKSILLQIGGFDEKLRYWQEYELLIRLAQETLIYAVQECLFVYRIDECDNQRLTNKYMSWKFSVHSVHKKHRRLYKRLPIVKQIDAIRMYHSEAYNRAKKNNLKTYCIKHKLVCYLLKRVRYIISVVQPENHEKH